MDMIANEVLDLVELAPEVADAAHLFWDTPFSEYTVSEGLLLLIALMGFIWILIYFFKGGL